MHVVNETRCLVSVPTCTTNQIDCRDFRLLSLVTQRVKTCHQINIVLSMEQGVSSLPTTNKMDRQEDDFQQEN